MATPDETAESDIRLVVFPTRDAFFSALQPYDSCFTSYAVGSLLELEDPEKGKTLLGVYRGDELLITLTGRILPFQFVLSSIPSLRPTTPEQLTHALTLLVTSPHLPTSFDWVWGPVELQRAFVDAYVSARTQEGVSVELGERDYESTISYATRQSVLSRPRPRPRRLSSPGPETGVRIARAEEGDIPVLVEMYVAFSRIWMYPDNPEHGLVYIRSAVHTRRVWVAFLPSSSSSSSSSSHGEEVSGGEERVGFVLVGRITPRTLSIKHVYTLPTHRRRGIAAHMVSAVVRFYLGLSPSGVEGAVEVGEHELKEQICLNVVDKNVEALYKRVGFFLGDGEEGKDVETGRMGWYRTTIRPMRTVMTEHA